jgi:[ribosomal protein S5]-alanine N-acetyltransferase
MVMLLETPRLLVREFTLDDLDGLTAVYADPQVLWWEPEPYTRRKTQEALSAIIGRYAGDGIGEYAMVSRATGEVVGECGPAYREIEGRLLPELGWCVRSDHWDRGYATEAARAVASHVAGLGIPRVYSLITPGNHRSQRVALKLGMDIERHVVWADRPHDLWTLALA